MPSITGVDNTGTATAGQTYDVSESYTAIAGSVTGELGEVGTWTIIFDQPFGADILYDTDSSTSQLGGTFADLGSNAITALGRYEVNDQFSVFGGLRFQQAGGDVGLGGLAYAAGFASSSGAESSRPHWAPQPLAAACRLRRFWVSTMWAPFCRAWRLASIPQQTRPRWLLPRWAQAPWVRSRQARFRASAP